MKKQSSGRRSRAADEEAEQLTEKLSCGWESDKMIEYHELIDSTNLRCAELGREHAENYSAVVARAQTAGRGRKGRSWDSEDDGGVYFSLLVRSEMDINIVSMLTLVAAYATADELRNMGFDCKIKWPNDIVLNGRKICGILTELGIDDRGERFLVIGIGINVNNTGFAAELEGKATSIYLETGRQLLMDSRESKTEFVSNIIDRFRKIHMLVENAKSLEPILRGYNSILANRDSYVRVLDPKGEYQAFALGIGPMGGLEVRKDSGEIEFITGGEVSVRGIMGYI